VTLSARRVVVVGGTSGMGLATVRAAAAQGAEVVSADRRSAGARDAIAGVRHAQVDVTDEASVRSLFADIGSLDHLLVSASPGAPGPFLEQDLAAARTFIDGKLLGSWTCARYAAPRMRPGGSITIITGCAAVRPPRNAATVTSAFAGVDALSRALALELGPLRVSTIRPGYTDSEMWSGFDDLARESLRGRVAEALPVGRVGTPEGSWRARPHGRE
jgi:NAD(P)-dependent dehydrogenase (short-subunit alcohol dehydrogenase family)